MKWHLKYTAAFAVDWIVLYKLNFTPSLVTMYTQNRVIACIFTARCYASAVYAVVMCLSITSQYCIKTTEQIEVVFGMDASFHLSHAVF